MAGQESRLQHISEWNRPQRALGEAETLVAGLLREAELSGSADVAMRGIARILDELAARLDRHMAYCPCVEPPQPLRTRTDELVEDRTRIRLR